MSTHRTKFWELIKNFWVELTLVTRVFSAIYILVNPLWGSFWYLVFDWTDSQFMLRLAHTNRVTYHKWDKVLDWFGYFSMIYVSIVRGYMHWIMAIFIAIRFFGQVIFMFKQKFVYFIIFPDVFSFMFYWFVVAETFEKKPVLYSQEYWMWLAILIILKIVQEIYLHLYWDRYIRGLGLEYLPFRFKPIRRS